MRSGRLRFAAMTPSVTLVVHLAGSREEAECCLRTIAALNPIPAHEVVVLDDATAGLEGVLGGLPVDARLLRNERREGLVACAVRAAAQAAGEIVVVLRGAPELQPGAIEPLLSTLSDSDIGAAAACLPLRPDSHPACTHALALRRGDLAALQGVVGVEPGFELAAICAEIASGGRRIVTVSTAVAGPPRPRASVTRGKPGAPPEVTVVIPTLDAASERVRGCVTAVQARTDAPHQIVLIDNGGPPQGFTAPVNSGLRAVDTPYAVVMNDDVEPESGWWTPLRNALDGGASVVFPLTEGSWFRTDFSAWCFALRRETLDEMSHAPGEFFDPELRVWYQDTDLLTRLRLVGRPPELVRESRIRHGLSLTVESEDPELRTWIESTVREDRAAFRRKHPAVSVHADE